MNKRLPRRLVDGLGVFSLGLGAAQLTAPGAINRLIGAEDNPANRALQRWAGGAREFAAGVGLESRRMTALWLWARVAGDAFDLTVLSRLLGSARGGDARRRAAIATAAVAGVTLADLAAATTVGRRGGRTPVHAAARITVNRPVSEVYAAWRKLENLPRFMTHLAEVRQLGDGRSHWRASGPAGLDVEWDAEITRERADEHLAWESVGKATVRNSGRVDFRQAPGGRGTEIRVHLDYDPPGGAVGAAVAKLFGEEPDQQVRDDLRRFKQLLEVGEVVRSEGSPDGPDVRGLATQHPAQPLPV
ncbi:Uncharacterized membrane protein [Amycolatopsis sacchari]|uniref:Uncharacterized membrane protein n=1 Tax=Amycolatopsis sacchari TaxID=115433 RepID=A0A1I3JUB9_9PSEU|nr:SRPBCC family protein [Amycolatopsis sacchari]SFI63852.1 Uncharacterized membrane protein [Amycolatopsis sacchari]